MKALDGSKWSRPGVSWKPSFFSARGEVVHDALAVPFLVIVLPWSYGIFRSLGQHRENQAGRLWAVAVMVGPKSDGRTGDGSRPTGQTGWNAEPRQPSAGPGPPGWRMRLLAPGDLATPEIFVPGPGPART